MENSVHVSAISDTLVFLLLCSFFVSNFFLCVFESVSFRTFVIVEEALLIPELSVESFGAFFGISSLQLDTTSSRIFLSSVNNLLKILSPCLKRLHSWLSLIYFYVPDTTLILFELLVQGAYEVALLLNVQLPFPLLKLL